MPLADEQAAARLAQVFQALAHPRRLVILECLLEDRERTVGSLAACERLAPCSQPNASQHLAVLRKAGIVQERRDGAHVHYRVADRRVARLLETARALDRAQLEALLGATGGAA